MRRHINILVFVRGLILPRVVVVVVVFSFSRSVKTNYDFLSTVAIFFFDLAMFTRIISLLLSMALRKQPTVYHATTGFPAE